MSLGAGEVFAGYTVVRLLGSGGMGEVYLATHPRLPRQDAIKVLPAVMSGDTDFRARFEREADLAATLWHPHVVGVHDRGEDEGRLWIAMDYVDGSDAARVLRDEYPNGVPADEVLDIVTAIADALDYAHERQLLHRDVKPANIMLTAAPRRRILLTDFGIARRSDDSDGLTATNMTIGSVAYTAPEQLMGDDLDGRADQYSLAATAYHLLSGSPPFTHTNPTVVISRHLTTPAPAIDAERPDLAAFGSAIARALAKSPSDRFATCQDFATALRKSLAGGDAEPTVTSGPTEHFVSSNSEPTVLGTTAHADGESTTFMPKPAAANETSPPMFVSSWDAPERPTIAAEPPTMAGPSRFSQVGPPPTAPPQYMPPHLPPQPPPAQRSSNSALPWILAGVAALVIFAIVLIAFATGGSDNTAYSGNSATTTSSRSQYPGATADSSTSSTTPTTTERARVTPPPVSGLDANRESCTGGIPAPGGQGWASLGTRGSDATTCFFSGQVVAAYWAAGTPTDAPRDVVARGAVACSGPARCSGDQFVMSCRVEGSDPWITCRGGRNAIVYLY